MIATALAASVLCLYPVSVERAAERSTAGDIAGRAVQEDRQKEFERRKKAAGEDVEALWELYLWCDAYGMEREGRKCLLAIIRVDEDHEQARAKLGHVRYDGKWFTTERKLEEYKKEEAERLAKEQGLVRHKGEWVSPEDIPYLERGLVRGEDGLWITKEEHEKVQAGWQRQDLVWIPPDELENIEKGLWKCGEEWKTLTEANRYHSELDRWWLIPAEHFRIYATCERETATKALDVMDLARRDMVRLFGVAPTEPLPVAVLRDVGQYGRFAAGAEGQRAPTELGALSSVHFAYFAEAWFDAESGKRIGAGVCYWDASTEDGNRWGPLAVRHAAAQSFVEGIDPSPETTAKVEKAGGFDGRDGEDFWKEKRFPEWLRFGAAGYAERYFIDGLVKAGGNPYWAREWSISNLNSQGGLRPLGQVFDGRMTIDDREGSARLINERGLVIAFVLDGECEPVGKAHEALKAVLADEKSKKKDVERAVAALRKAIEKNESELRAFAGL